MFSSVTEDVCMSMKFLSNAAVVHLSANTYPQLPLPSVVSVHANLQFALNRWNPAYAGTSFKSENNKLAIVYLFLIVLTDVLGQLQVTIRVMLTMPKPSSPICPSLWIPSYVSYLPIRRYFCFVLFSVNSNEIYLGLTNLSGSYQIATVTSQSGFLARRHLGDNFSQKVRMRSNCFITTVDSRFLMACGFWDNSFRVFTTDTGMFITLCASYRDSCHVKILSRLL
jgi:hypothetical protein